MSVQRLTAHDVSRVWTEDLQAGRPLSMWLLGDLCDDFRQRCNVEERKLLVAQEPLWLDVHTHSDCNAYLAATVESLCREASLAPPRWTEDARCFLSRPWFAGGMESLKAILIAESPVAFRRRNLFVSANALSRV